MLRYVSRWVGQTLVILGMLLGLSPVAFAQTSLENGTYTLSNNVIHDNPVGQGMARSYTEEQSDLVVSKDGLWLTLGFNNTQYMGEFTIKVNGSQASYDVVYNSNNIKKLKFKIPSLEATVSVGMYVVPMNTEVEYTVTLNQGSLKLIEKEVVEEVKTEEPVTKPESSSGNSSQTESSTQNNNQVVTKPSTSTQVGSQSQGSSQTKPEQSTSVEVSTVPAENSAQTQIKVEEETSKVDGQVEISEKSEQEDVVAETEELVSEETDAQEPEVEEAISEIIENQEAVEETIQEEVVMQEKESLLGIAVMIIAVIVLVGGVYYWYIKIRK